ncbi:MAG: ACT domain-containing protein [Eubacteriales bacterium]
MRAIVSVLGKDRPGIIARISGILFNVNINILDINQTVLRDEVFVMTMLVDMNGCNVSFDEIKDELDACAKDLGMDIRLQREEIFNSMHRV